MCTQQGLWESESPRNISVGMQTGPIKSKFVTHRIGRGKAQPHRLCVHVHMCGPMVQRGAALRSWATDRGNCGWPRNNLCVNASIAQALKRTLICKFSNAYYWERKLMADVGQFLEDGEDASCPQLALTLCLWVMRSIFPGSSAGPQSVWSSKGCTCSHENISCPHEITWLQCGEIFLLRSRYFEFC